MTTKQKIHKNLITALPYVSYVIRRHIELIDNKIQKRCYSTLKKHNLLNSQHKPKVV